VTGVLVGAVILLTALTLLNIAMVMAVVRRLREHETRIAALAGGAAVAPPLPEIIAPVGHRVEDFTAETVDGRRLDRTSLQSPALVGFFSPSCDSCHERIPDFRKAAADHDGSALAVVVRDGKDPAELVADLDGSATIVLEAPEGPLAGAFGVRGFPAFALLDAEGTIRARGYELPLTAP
jgi:thiol-disulfide isomerase/thioredoxin